MTKYFLQFDGKLALSSNISKRQKFSENCQESSLGSHRQQNVFILIKIAMCGHYGGYLPFEGYLSFG